SGLSLARKGLRGAVLSSRLPQSRGPLGSPSLRSPVRRPASTYRHPAVSLFDRHLVYRVPSSPLISPKTNQRPHLGVQRLDVQTVAVQPGFAIDRCAMGTMLLGESSAIWNLFA